MPAITATNMQTAGDIALTVVTLDGATDTFTYNASANPVLVLDNVTAGALTPVIDGDGGTTVPVSGAPGGLNVSGGYTLSEIAAGDKVVLRLKSISAYLSGTISVTGGTGIEASLLEF